MFDQSKLVRCIAAMGLLFSSPALADGVNPGEWTRAYCNGSKSTILILIDRTTAYDAIDSQILDEGLYSSIAAAKPGERIVIRTIAADPFASKRVFDGCRPGCEETKWSWLTCNSIGSKPLVDKFYRSAAKGVESLRKDSEVYPRSSIFSTVSVVTQEYRDAQLRRIVVLSDLLENSPEISTQMILKNPPTMVLKKLRALGLSPRSLGTEVVIYGVGRSDATARQGLRVPEYRNLRAIWTEWFVEGGATCVEIYQWFPTAPCRAASAALDLGTNR